MKDKHIYYSLTAAQKILFFSQKFTLYKQVNNIFTLVLVEKELDFTLLKKAIEIAFSHNDSMHLQLTRVEGEIKQFFLESEAPRIETLDFTGQSQEQMDRKLYKIASVPFLILNRPLSRIYMIRSCDGMVGLYFGVSHIILDSWGICVHLKYIMDVYNALEGNTPMPKPIYPHEPLLARDADYKNTPQYPKDLEFWKEECSREEPFYTHINGPSVLEAYRKKKKNNNLRGGSGFTLKTKARHETILIPKEDVALMEAFSSEHSIPMQTLFLLAFRTCMSRLNSRQNDISIHATVARRGTLQEKQSGGTRVHPVIFRTIIMENTSFIQALEQVYSRQSQLYRHAEMDMLEVRKLMEETYCKGDLRASYQSATLTFQPVRLTLNDGTPCHTKWYSNGVSSQSFYLTIMDDDGSGALRCYYEYQISTVAMQKVIDFHTYMMKVILAGISDKDITIGALLDME